MAKAVINNNTSVYPQGPSIPMGGKHQNANLGKLGGTTGPDGRPVNGSSLQPIKTPQHNVISAKTSAPGFSQGKAFAERPVNGGVRI